MKKLFYFALLSAMIWQANAASLTPISKQANWEQGGLKTWIYNMPWVGADCSVWEPEIGRNTIVFPTDTTLQDATLRTNEYPIIDKLLPGGDLMESRQAERAFVGIWKGYLEIKTAGTYKFYVWAENIAEVTIGSGSGNTFTYNTGNTQVLNNGGAESESIDLTPGFYPILIHFVNITPAWSAVYMGYTPVGATAQIQMTNDMFWHDPFYGDDIQKSTWGLNFTKWLWTEDLKNKAYINPANISDGCYPDSIKFDAVDSLLGGTLDYKTIDGLVRGEEYQKDVIIPNTFSYQDWWNVAYPAQCFYSFRQSMMKGAGDTWTGVWTGSINITTAGTYQFQMQGDDNFRMYLDGNLIIDGWYAILGNGRSANDSRTLNGEHISGWDAINESEQFNLTQGLHSIKLVLNQSAGGCYLRLDYKNIETDFDYKHVTKDMFRTTYNPPSTRIESINGSEISYKVLTTKGKVILTGLNGVSKICVYSFAGLLILDKNFNSTSAEFCLAAGNYIVSVNGKAKKISVK
jgi:hypothetical protein